MSYQKILLILLLNLWIAGCAAQNKRQFRELDGQWQVELNSTDIGLVKTAFTFETDDSTFFAYTRQGATKDILGFWKATLAKIFTDDFKKGSLIRITDGIIERNADTLVLRGIFRSAVGNYYFNGTVVAKKLSGRLTSAEHEPRGNISGNKTKVTFPLADYPKIVTDALETATNNLYNPSMTKSEEWIEFSKNIKGVSLVAMDDVEMVFAWYYFAQKLPLSHFALVKMAPQQNDDAKDELNKGTLLLSEKTKNTDYLKIKSFGGTAKEMDSVFAIIKNRNYQNLIVDLRNNSGGSVEAGMAFAKNVVDTPLTGGIFLTQKWFSTHNRIPDTSQYGQFPHFTKANFDLIIKGIHEEKGLVLKVVPNEKTYQGKLFILTNNNTASTCEPIVYSLKNTGRAIVVGEKTAGAMLNGEAFELSNGFSVIVPTADYYTADGYRIDQNGVTPNFEVTAASADEYVLRNLIAD